MLKTTLPDFKTTKVTPEHSLPNPVTGIKQRQVAKALDNAAADLAAKASGRSVYGNRIFF